MADLRREMDRMLHEVLGRHRDWQRAGSWVDIPTEHGERHQRVHIELAGSHWGFRTVVLRASEVTRTKRGWRELAMRAWLRNDATNLVTFTFDGSDRLIGLIQHPAAHLDADELELYLSVLAAECDRFEYHLGGVDVF
jgi:hypothetical protein